MLREAVPIFGKGKVTTNLLFGLGETNHSISQTMEDLAEQGIVVTLRKLRTNHANRQELEQSLRGGLPQVHSERIIDLAISQREILERHGLTTKTFYTMCLRCGCCDLIPFWDV
jgi:biotin synthase-related radical SAM superfamily protein